MIRIVSDSTSDLSQEILDRYDIKMVPLHIVMDDKEYRDRIEITQQEIFDWAEKNKTTPKTSAVSFDDANAVIKPIIDAGDEAIVFVISETMSTTGNVFRLVAEELDASDRVHVYNSHSLSNGVGILAIEAAEMVQEGRTVEEILAELDILREKNNTSFVIDTLQYLARGGRCSSVVALAGGVLRLHPQIYLEGGNMEVGKKYRGKIAQVELEYVKDLEEKMRNSRKKRIFLVSTSQPAENVAAVREYLESLNHFDEIIESSAGGVISSHCGPGTLGVMFLEN